MQQGLIVNNIFDEKPSFTEKALDVMHFQHAANSIYQQWNDLLKADIAQIQTITAIPFLPVSFFKTHEVVSGSFEPACIFESSGTSKTSTSRHFVKDAALYRQSFMNAFRLFYGNVQDWCIIGLLPSYLEQQHSSLIVMVHTLIEQSKHTNSGFYLYAFEELHRTIVQLEAAGQKTLLICVTYALLDFAEQFPIKLTHTVVMETGGMKGRREELTRSEVHAILCEQFGVPHVHSEYGMTELLSQAYSKGEGRFVCPPWMKVLVREEGDPLSVKEWGRGVLNIIDLANLYSCSFIATDDVGIVYEDGSFEVLGRMDNSDIRGCSLLAL